MTWLKWLGLGILALVILVAVALLWSRIKYGKNPLIKHKRITITLPYDTAHEATHLIPMGETIEHNFPGGHPGIDFQWVHAVPLIAVADGTITNISNADDKGETVQYVTLTMGEYAATYKELDTVAVTKGQSVKQGDTMGTPHCHSQDGHKGCQVHWEFAYASFLVHLSGAPDRLCPLTYFDADALLRVKTLWDSIPSSDRFKKDFPDICSNVYLNHDR